MNRKKLFSSPAEILMRHFPLPQCRFVLERKGLLAENSVNRHCWLSLPLGQLLTALTFYFGVFCESSVIDQGSFLQTFSDHFFHLFCWDGSGNIFHQNLERERKKERRMAKSKYKTTTNETNYP